MEMHLCPIEHEAIIQIQFPEYSQGKIIPCFHCCLLRLSVCLTCEPGWGYLPLFGMVGAQKKDCEDPEALMDTSEKNEADNPSPGCFYQLSIS